tara:strand:- start:2448 stop:3152 length:705 start_codon:yes stop_codon:yes gene_type:complete
MADEYVVRIVLDGVDNASDDISRVEEELEGLTGTAGAATLDFAMFTGGMASMIGGLNQFTGGLRKSHGAMERLGIGTEETRDQLAEMLDWIELFTGPLESLLALFLLGAGAVAVFGSEAFAAGAASIGLTSAASALGVSLGTLVGIIAGVIVVVVLLAYTLMFHRDAVVDMARGFREWADYSDELDAALLRLKNTVDGLFDSLRSSGGNLVENIDNKFRKSIFGGGGGSITRLA